MRTLSISILILAVAAPVRAVGRAQKRAAYKQWDAGVSSVLDGEYGRARTQWKACLRLDPDNEDCKAGLKLLDRGKTGRDAGPVAKTGYVREDPLKKEGGALDAESAARYARELYEEGDYKAAYYAAKAALDQDSDNSAALAVLKLTEKKKDAGSDTGPVEAQERQAVRHWNNGIIFYQKQDYAKAQMEWLLCTQLDPANKDCRTGLMRIDPTHTKRPKEP